MLTGSGCKHQPLGYFYPSKFKPLVDWAEQIYLELSCEVDGTDYV